MKIRVPTGFKEVDVQSLSAKDLQDLFSFNSELAKLQQYTIEKSFDLKEKISIISVEIICDTGKNYIDNA